MQHGLMRVGALVLAATTAGCASSSRVGRLETKVSSLEQTALSEAPIMVTRAGNPDIFAILLGGVLSQYKDEKSRETASRYANALAIVPTLSPNQYYVVVMRDDGDGQPTPRADRTYPDGSGESMRIGFDLTTYDLPDAARAWLMNVRGR